MKIYLIERTDNIDYDEFDAMVIIADNPEEVLSIAAERDNDEHSVIGTRFKEETTVITVIGTPNSKQKKGIILASFNAG